MTNYCSFTKSGDDLVASGPFTGAVRAAAVWTGKEGDIATLDAHAEKIPVGGSVSAEVAGDVAHMVSSVSQSQTCILTND